MKVIKCILPLLMALLLCSCTISSYTLATKGKLAPDGETTKLKLILFEGQSGFLEAAAAAYSGGHPNISVQVERLPNDTAYNAKILSDSYSDNPAVGFAVNGGWDADFWKQDVQPLPFEWLYKAPSELTFPVSDNGKCYALPLNLTGYGIVYNLDLLVELGIDTSGLHTAEGLAAAVQAMGDKIAANEAGGIETALCSDCALSPFVPVEANTNKLQLKQLTGLQGVLDLLPSSGQQDKAAMLAERRAVFYLGESAIQSQVRELNKEAANELRISPFSLNGQPATHLTVGCDYLTVSRTAGQAEQNALFDFLNWLYTSSEGQEVLTSYGVVSPYSDTSSSSLQSSVYSFIRTQKAAYSAQGEFPSGWKSDDFEPLLDNYRQQKATWEDVVGELEGKWNFRYRT